MFLFAEESRLQPSTVPTVFTWSHGGRQVYVTGTFNGWKEKIPLTRSGQDFATIINLPPGLHHYKFVVDDDWSHAPEQNTVADSNGNTTNVIEVRPFEQSDDLATARELPLSSHSPPGSYARNPGPLDLEDLDPPSLPPHLFRSLLDSAPAAVADPTVLPVPQHVMLNHAYSLSRGPDSQVMVLGLTHRYKKRFVTTVFYAPIS
eukprot:TRINITY_DN4611_c0_g1_i1.p1 TRINITY_DN4611_c0_g1~~TRINITY_DN4611_c0_g1_i1.p1  ORF type:complete len:224 (+),score=37.70 TRINITY_DN4611_c0_g1_i1:61-672(+)